MLSIKGQPFLPIEEKDYKPQYSSITLDEKTGEPTKFVKDGITYLVSGECNRCGDCCRFYTTHGYNCKNFNRDTNLCGIQDKKPIWCRNFPGVEGFQLMSERCSYIITREDTGEVMKYGLQTTLKKQGDVLDGEVKSG